MATLNEIKRLRAICEECELEGREILAKYTDEELVALFNGAGPEAFPSWLRTALDALHPSLAPVAMIHDVEWDAPVAVGDQVGRTSEASEPRSGRKGPRESDGRRKTFAASNARFRRNGCKVASASPSAGGGRAATRSCGTP